MLENILESMPNVMSPLVGNVREVFAVRLCLKASTGFLRREFRT